MPIAATCDCGKTLRVKDELAGKKVRCPACKQPLTIPSAGGPSADGESPVEEPAGDAFAGASLPPAGQSSQAFSGGLDDLFEEEGLTQRQGATCPSCTKEMKPGAVLCIHCGFNTATGERFAEHKTEAERTILGHTLLDKASKDMADDIALQKKMQGTGLPWWALLLILLALIGTAIFFVIGMALLTSGGGTPE